MKVLPVNQNIINTKTTGYTAAASMALCALSGLTKNKCIKKYHKPLAYLTAFLTTLHIALAEYNHYIWKNKQM